VTGSADLLGVHGGSLKIWYDEGGKAAWAIGDLLIKDQYSVLSTAPSLPPLGQQGYLSVQHVVAWASPRGSGTPCHSGI
jgi:hypothetical protein